MDRAVTRAEMVALDTWAIREVGIPSLVLMENAGKHCADRVRGHFPDPTSAPRIAVFAGRGNNGGDGYVVARHLWNAGYEIDVAAPAGIGSDRPGSDPAVHAAVLLKLGVPMHDDLDACVRLAAGAGVIVDALFGTGLSGAPRPPYLDVIRALNEAAASGAIVIAVDIPSGLDCDTGEVPGIAVHASTTVTFQYPKIGFDVAEGPAHTGEVEVVDITIPRRGPGRPL